MVGKQTHTTTCDSEWKVKWVNLGQMAEYISFKSRDEEIWTRAQIAVVEKKREREREKKKRKKVE